ncbi:ABC transporter permease [Flexivirga meconopsidis]|uniref:ABC transporter permease n=1 Tax=Flexivirga meconopsidis TaxID=2977121 RepID=UPI0022408E8D|nr:ABC transporter permease [Flexivirga meconopsidis]
MLDQTQSAIATDRTAATRRVAPTKRGNPTLRALRAAWRRPTFLVAAVIIITTCLMALVPALFTSTDPQDCTLSNSRKGVSAGHPMGYDMQGCDYFSNVVHGARTSMEVGVLTALFIFIVALITGSLAGYFGGIVDSVVSRLADVLLGMPVMVASLVVLYQFRERTIWTIVFVLVLFGWAGTMRYMRGSVLQVKNNEYVQAARVLGVSSLTILRRHVLPNAIMPLIVMTTLGVGAGMTAEAGFAILGVGLKLPAYSWGLQIAQASRDGNWQLAPHLMLFPALMLGLCTLAFVVIGETLRDVLDVRSR